MQTGLSPVYDDDRSVDKQVLPFPAQHAPGHTVVLSPADDVISAEHAA